MLNNVRSPRQKQKLLKYLISQYPFKITRVKALPDYYIMYSDEGLKALHNYFGRKEELWLAYVVYEQLQSSSVLPMLKWEESSGGSPFVRLEGEIFYITEWHEGPPLSDDIEDLKIVASSLAKLHLVSREVILAQDFAEELNMPVPYPTVWSEELARLQETLNDLKARTNATKIDEKMYKIGSKILAEGQEAFEMLATVSFPDELSKGWSLEFSDLSYRNFVRVEGGFKYKPLHKEFKWGWRAQNLATVIAMMGNLEKSAIKSVLDSYLSVTSLEKWELDILPTLIRYPSDSIRFINNYQLSGSLNEQWVDTFEDIIAERRKVAIRLQAITKELEGQKNTVVLLDPVALEELENICREGRFMEEHKEIGTVEEDMEAMETGQEDVLSVPEDEELEPNGLPIGGDEPDNEVEQEIEEVEEAEGRTEETEIAESVDVEDTIDDLQGEEGEDENEDFEEETALEDNYELEEEKTQPSYEHRVEKYKQQYKKLIAWGPFPEPLNKKQAETVDEVGNLEEVEPEAE